MNLGWGPSWQSPKAYCMIDCNIWSEINEWHVCNECSAASAFFDELLPEKVSSIVFHTKFRSENIMIIGSLPELKGSLTWSCTKCCYSHYCRCLAYAGPFLAANRLLVDKGYSKLTYSSPMAYWRNQGTLRTEGPAKEYHGYKVLPIKFPLLQRWYGSNILLWLNYA